MSAKVPQDDRGRDNFGGLAPGDSVDVYQPAGGTRTGEFVSVQDGMGVVVLDDGTRTWVNPSDIARD